MSAEATGAIASSARRNAVAPVAFIALVGASIASLSGDWEALFSHDAAERMSAFIASFFPPALDTPFLLRVARGTAETFAMSLVGTAIAAVFGMGLALLAAAAVGTLARRVTRLLLNVLRAIPELVWAAIIVIAAGLGPLAGVLALAVHTTGVLGRLFADALENAAGESRRVLVNNGATAAAAFWYATLPEVLPQAVSYTLYRWENNIRAASVLGLVGAGGLGQLLYFHLSLFQTREAASAMIAILVLVGAVDAASYRLRTKLNG
ncbi:MAG: phosphonate ABC transporter, permease protein PhnE [Pseudomonadota bacterium]|nr:phosphonate ABC transporter, permease protein PhnE [Pseudomonadota bacterium]